MRAARTNVRGTEKLVGRLLAVLIVAFVASREAQSQASTITTQTGCTTEHHRKVVVSIPHRKLALIEDGKVQQIYPVAVGAEVSPSPTGVFEVKSRLVKPTYYHPGKVIPAGSNNPLGTRWIGLSTKGYGIHGTNIESSIGKAASHGCIRMHRKDLEQLFAAVQVGDQVEIRGESDEELASIFEEVAGSAVSADAPVAAVSGQ
jgi:lipoprotein-anchoring transpeptidase ErfK/SrfK